MAQAQCLRSWRGCRSRRRLVAPFPPAKCSRSTKTMPGRRSRAFIDRSPACTSHLWRRADLLRPAGAQRLRTPTRPSGPLTPAGPAGEQGQVGGGHKGEVAGQQQDRSQVAGSLAEPAGRHRLPPVGLARACPRRPWAGPTARAHLEDRAGHLGQGRRQPYGAGTPSTSTKAFVEPIGGWPPREQDSGHFRGAVGYRSGRGRLVRPAQEALTLGPRHAVFGTACSKPAWQAPPMTSRSPDVRPKIDRAPASPAAVRGRLARPG